MFDWEILVWVGVMVLSISIAICIEEQIATLAAIWFALASLISMALSIFGAPVWIQGLLFLVLAAIGFVLFKIMINRKSNKTNLDAIIGKKGIVIEKISNIYGKGTVNLGGQVWSACSADDSVIEEGTFVEVKCIRGVKLVCKVTE